MNRLFRQFLTFLILLILAALLRLPFRGSHTNEDSFIGRHVANFKEQLRLQQIVLDFDTLSTRFPASAELKGASVEFRRQIPISIEIEQLSLRLKLLSLLLLKTHLHGSAKLYHGKAVIDYLSPWLTGQNTLNIDGGKIQLAKNPQLNALGIAGQVEIKFQSDFRQPIATTNAKLIRLGRTELELILDHGSYSGGHKIAGLLALPSATDIRAEIRSTGEGNKFTIHSFSFLSSLGTVEGRGVITSSDSFDNIERLDIELSISLTAEGAKSLGPYLALAAGSNIEKPVRNWNLELKKEGRLSGFQSRLIPNR